MGSGKDQGLAKLRKGSRSTTGVYIDRFMTLPTNGKEAPSPFGAVIN
jgi:hypothetical protein